MTRTVSDLATLLDVMAGYDPEDPGTALGFGKCPESYTHSLDPNGLNGARIGILSQSMGFECQPDTDDFRLVPRYSTERSRSSRMPEPQWSGYRKFPG